MIKLFVSLLVICSVIVNSQVLRNVFVKNNAQYMCDVIQATVTELENRHWNDLKLEDFHHEVNETVLGVEVLGQVNYTSGFVVSIQHVDILKSSLNQIWTQTNGTVRVELRGQLRMTNVKMGLDVHTNVLAGRHFYTGAIVHPLITADFSIFRDVHTREMTVAVTSTQPNNNIIRIQMLPLDAISDKLYLTYRNDYTQPGVAKWGTEVLQPIAEDIVTNKLKFPGLCYNCNLITANPGWDF